jgi:hypothetical protein
LFAFVALLLASCGEVTPATTDAAPGSFGLSIEGVTPGSGPVAGGTVLTIRGVGLAGSDVTVTVGGVASTDVTVVSDNVILARTPPGKAPGVVDVSVLSSFGFGIAAESFEYSNALTVAQIVPSFGLPEGGTEVTIKGSGFMTGMTGNLDVTFDDQAVEFTIEDDSTLKVTSPAGVAFEAIDVRIANRNGTVERKNGFRFLPPGMLLADGRVQSHGSVYHLDPDTMTARRLFDLDVPITGLAISDTGNTVASTSRMGQYATIGSLDLATGEYVDVVSSPSPYPDIAVRDGKVIAHKKGDGIIYEIDPATAEAQMVSFAPCYGCGIAGTPEGNLVLAPEGSQGRLFGVNQAGQLAILSDLDDQTGSDAVSAMTFYRGMLYAVRKGFYGAGVPPGGGGDAGSALLRIDPTTGAVELMGALPGGTDAIGTLPLQPPPEQ